MTCEACKDRLVKSELQIKSLERILERAKGIEPSYRAWEALVCPSQHCTYDCT